MRLLLALAAAALVLPGTAARPTRRSSRATCRCAGSARCRPRRRRASRSSGSTGRARAASSSAPARRPGAGAPGSPPHPRATISRTAVAPSGAWRLAARQPVLGRDLDRDPLPDRTATCVACGPGSSGARRCSCRCAPLSIAGSPPIVRRSAWRADESIVRAKPAVVDRLEFAVVHHTAGRNAYSPAESAAIVRGIELFHVKGNGWNDIGYNFLVDRFGTVFEGRGGGIDRNVVGAHAEGFNTGSVGVAVIGDYSATHRAEGRGGRARRACSPGGSTSRTSTRSTMLTHALRRESRALPAAFPSSSARSPAIATRASPRVRATRSTRGSPTIAGRLGALGLPKLYEPRVTGTVGRTVRFRAQALVVAALAGRDHRRCRARGRVRRRGRRRGRLVVGRDPGAEGRLPLADRRRPERARRERGPRRPMAPSPARAHERRRAAGGDQPQRTTARPTTTTLTLHALRARDGLDQRPRPVGSDLGYLRKPVRKAGGHLHRRRSRPRMLGDGSYQLFIQARATTARRSTSLTARARHADARALRGHAGRLLAERRRPQGSARGLVHALVARAVRVRVLRDGKYVATLTNGRSSAPGHRRSTGTAPSGSAACSTATTRRWSRPPTRSASPRCACRSSRTRSAPVVRVLKGRPLRLWVSEPSLVTLRVNGVALRQDVKRAGEVRVAWRGSGGPGARRRVGRGRQREPPALAALSRAPSRLARHATLAAPYASNRAGPAARAAARLREAQRSDRDHESEGRRSASARRAVLAPRTARGAARRGTSSPIPRTRATRARRRSHGSAPSSGSSAASRRSRPGCTDWSSTRAATSPASGSRSAASRSARTCAPRPSPVRPIVPSWPSSRAELRRELAVLPVAQARVVVLKDALGLSFPEISDGRRLPVGTAKCYAHRGRATLRARLEPRAA